MQALMQRDSRERGAAGRRRHAAPPPAPARRRGAGFLTPGGIAFACAVSLLGVGGMARAEGAQGAAAAAQAAAEDAVRAHFAMPGDRVDAKAVPLSARLHLAACAVPPRASVPQSIKPLPLVTTRVECPVPGGWNVRVTVRMRLFRDVLVTTRPLQRGDGLGAGDVRVEARDITRLGYGYLTDLAQATTRTLARALPAGSVLTPQTLGGRRMVRAGDRVSLIASMDGIVVRADGIALGSGDSGARLRVRNAASGRIVDGVVKAPGEVDVLP